MSKYIGKRIVPKHCGEWDKTKEYEMLNIVLYSATGESFMSRKEVPAGVEITDCDYWAVCSRFSQQVKDMETHLSETEERLTAYVDENVEKMESELAETENSLKQDVSDNVAKMEEELTATESKVTEQTEKVQSLLEDGIQKMEESSDMLNRRMDNLVSNKTLDSDSELLDIRVDEYGTTHETAGTAIREASMKKAEKNLAYGMPFVYQGGINLNTADHTIEFSSNFIFLAGGKYRFIKSPEPIAYNPDALLTYLCFDPETDMLSTADWHASPPKDTIVVFVVDCQKPKLSYGKVPFTVDGFQPFREQTLQGKMLEKESLTDDLFARNSIAGYVLQDGSVSAEKLLPGSLMSFPLQMDYEKAVFGKANVEMGEDGSISVVSDDTMGDGYRGGGFVVNKPEVFEKLYIHMEYTSNLRLEFYVVGGYFYRVSALPSSDGERTETDLEIEWEKLKETGDSDVITVVFTANKPFELTIHSLRVGYTRYTADNFGEDYSEVHERLDAAEEAIKAAQSSLADAGSAMETVVKTQTEQAGKMSAIEKALSNAGAAAYAGKKVLFLGDSITALNTGKRGWVRYFNEIIQPASFVNLSVASARWCDYSDTVYDGNPVFSGADKNHNNTMGNQIEKLLRGKDSTHENYTEVPAYADFDMILIACGTNDGTNTADIEPFFTDNNETVSLDTLDRTKFAAAFRYSIEKLTGMYPSAKIFICTPIQGYITTRSYSTTKAKGDYLKLLAGRMSLEVIDVFNCGVCDIYEKKNANGRYLIDGLHPNVDGAKLMGKFIAQNVISRYR